MIYILRKKTGSRPRTDTFEVWTDACETRGFGGTQEEAVADHVRCVQAKLDSLKETLRDLKPPEP